MNEIAREEVKEETSTKQARRQKQMADVTTTTRLRILIRRQWRQTKQEQKLIERNLLWRKYGNRRSETETDTKETMDDKTISNDTKTAIEDRSINIKVKRIIEQTRKDIKRCFRSS